MSLIRQVHIVIVIVNYRIGISIFINFECAIISVYSDIDIYFNFYDV